MARAPHDLAETTQADDPSAISSAQPSPPVAPQAEVASAALPTPPLSAEDIAARIAKASTDGKPATRRKVTAIAEATDDAVKAKVEALIAPDTVDGSFDPTVSRQCAATRVILQSMSDLPQRLNSSADADASAAHAVASVLNATTPEKIREGLNEGKTLFGVDFKPNDQDDDTRVAGEDVLLDEQTAHSKNRLAVQLLSGLKQAELVKIADAGEAAVAGSDAAASPSGSATAPATSSDSGAAAPNPLAQTQGVLPSSFPSAVKTQLGNQGAEALRDAATYLALLEAVKKETDTEKLKAIAKANPQNLISGLKALDDAPRANVSAKYAPTLQREATTEFLKKTIGAVTNVRELTALATAEEDANIQRELSTLGGLTPAQVTQANIPEVHQYAIEKYLELKIEAAEADKLSRLRRQISFA